MKQPESDWGRVSWGGKGGKGWGWVRMPEAAKVVNPVAAEVVEFLKVLKIGTFANTKAVNTQLSNFQNSVHVGMWCSFWNVFKFVFVSHDIGSMLSN